MQSIGPEMAFAIRDDAIERFSSLFKNTDSIKVGGFSQTNNEVKLSAMRLIAKIITSSQPEQMKLFMLYDLSRSKEDMLIK